MSHGYFINFKVQSTKASSSLTKRSSKHIINCPTLLADFTIFVIDIGRGQTENIEDSILVDPS